MIFEVEEGVVLRIDSIEYMIKASSQESIDDPIEEVINESVIEEIEDEKPISLNGDLFEIRTKEDERLLIIDSNGNLMVKGIVNEFSDMDFDEDDFAIENNGIQGVVKNPEGDLNILGQLIEDEEISKIEDSFIIKNSNEEVIALFNQKGDMEIKGTASQNVIFPK